MGQETGINHMDRTHLNCGTGLDCDTGTPPHVLPAVIAQDRSIDRRRALRTLMRIAGVAYCAPTAFIGCAQEDDHHSSSRPPLPVTSTGRVTVSFDRPNGSPLGLIHAVSTMTDVAMSPVGMLESAGLQPHILPPATDCWQSAPNGPFVLDPSTATSRPLEGHRVYVALVGDPARPHPLQHAGITVPRGTWVHWYARLDLGGVNVVCEKAA